MKPRISLEAIRAGRIIDVAVVLALFVIVAQLGTLYLHRLVERGTKPEFYQVHFGPAVLTACGRGYLSPARGAIPSLDRFLALQQEQFSCADVPSTFATAPLTGSQLTWRYLLLSAALVWKISDVSWSALLPLPGVMFGATIAGCYVLFRVVAGTILSLFGSLLVASSPLHWTHLPYFRDYAKAPFMVGVWILLALLLGSDGRWRSVLPLSAAFGVLVAIGSGFRNDLLIAIPAFVIIIVAFLPGRTASHAWVKAGALIVGLTCFLLSARPLLVAYAEGGGASMQHVVLLGLTDSFNPSLGILEPPYEFARPYDDRVIGGIVSDYAGRIQGRRAIQVYGTGYDAAATGLLIDQAKTFPADLAARAYAAVLQVLDLPASNYVDRSPLPAVEEHTAVSVFYNARSQYIRQWWWLGPAALTAALGVGLAENPRIALGALFLVLYFSGYSALQFGMRHFFHLNIVPVLALVFVLSRVPKIPTIDWRVSRQPVIRVAIRLAMVVAAVVAPLEGLRWYQTRAVAGTLEDRLNAPSALVTFAASPRPAARIALNPVEPLPAEKAARAVPASVQSEYLAIDVDAARCPVRQSAVTIQYDYPFEQSGFTQTLAVPLRGGKVSTLLVPVFFRYEPDTSDPNAPPDARVSYHFRGLELDAVASPCISKISRILNPSRYGTLVTAVLPPDWRTKPLYQRMAFEGRRDAQSLNAAPPNVSITDAMLSSTDEAKIANLDENMRPAGPSRWTMRGTGRSAFTYLLVTESSPGAAGDTALVEGLVREGGLSIGIVRDDSWIVTADVMAPGPFLTVLRVPSDGKTAIVVANNLTGASWRQDVDLTRIAWRHQSAAPR